MTIFGVNIPDHIYVDQSRINGRHIFRVTSKDYEIIRPYIKCELVLNLPDHYFDFSDNSVRTLRKKKLERIFKISDCNTFNIYIIELDPEIKTVIDKLCL